MQDSQIRRLFLTLSFHRKNTRSSNQDVVFGPCPALCHIRRERERERERERASEGERERERER